MAANQFFVGGPSVRPNFGSPDNFIRNLGNIVQQRRVAEQKKLDAESLAANRSAVLQQGQDKLTLQQQIHDDNVAAPELERERVKQLAIEQNNIVSGVLNNPFKNNALLPDTLKGIQESPGFINLTKDIQKFSSEPGQRDTFTPEFSQGLAQQRDLMNNFIQQLAANPQSIRDPNKITKEIGEIARSQGIPEQRVKELQAQGIESFKTLSPEIQKFKLDRLNTEDTNTSKILAASITALGKSNKTTIGSASGLGRGTFKGDANARANQKVVDDFLTRSSSVDAANFLTKFGDFINPFNMTDVTREDLLPIINTLEQAGIRPLTGIQVLEGEGILVDGEFTPTFGNFSSTKDVIIGNTALMEKLVRQGRLIQDANASNTGGASSGSLATNLTKVLELNKIFTNNTDAKFNQIFANSVPRQRTVAERRQAGIDFVAEQTGVPNTPILPKPKPPPSTNFEDLVSNNTDSNVDETPVDTPTVGTLSKEDTKERNQLQTEIDELDKTTNLFGVASLKKDNIKLRELQKEVRKLNKKEDQIKEDQRKFIFDNKPRRISPFFDRIAESRKPDLIQQTLLDNKKDKADAIRKEQTEFDTDLSDFFERQKRTGFTTNLHRSQVLIDGLIKRAKQALKDGKISKDDIKPFGKFSGTRNERLQAAMLDLLEKQQQ